MTDPGLLPQKPEKPDKSAVLDPKATREEIRQLMRYSVWAALCPLLPVPLVDDYALAQVREKAMADLLRGRGWPATEAECQVLACGRPEKGADGCLSGCIRWVIVWPLRFLFKYVLKKILRKIFLIFTFKDCLTAFSRTFHQGWLVRHAFDQGWVPDPGLATGERWAAWASLRDLIEASLDEMSVRHFEHWARAIFRRSWRQVREAAAALAGIGRRGASDPEVQAELEQEVDSMKDLIDELTRSLAQEAAYLRQVEQRFEARYLARRSTSLATTVPEPPPAEPPLSDKPSH